MNHARGATIAKDRIFQAICSACIFLPLAYGTWFVVDTLLRGVPMLGHLARTSPLAFAELWLHARLVGAALGIAIPMGIGAAVFLEHLAAPSRSKRLAERSISFLAAIPSVLHGLCAFTVLVVCLGVQSKFVISALCLALFLFPVVVERTRIALGSVSPQIREASLALGADPLRTLVHVTLPLTFPALAAELLVVVARAFGTVAPLLVIDVFTPQPKVTFLMPLAVRIFRSGTDPDPSHQGPASAAVVVLLGILVLMHLGARWLTRRSMSATVERDGLSDRGAA